MALKIDKKKLGRFTYEVKQMGSRAGNDLLVRLGRVLGGGMAVLIGGRAGSFRDVSLAIDGIASRLEPAEFQLFCDALAPYTHFIDDAKKVRIEMKVEDLDLHFAGEYLEQLDWLQFCLEVNFKSFFDGLKSRAAATAQASTTNQPPQA